MIPKLDIHIPGWKLSWFLISSKTNKQTNKYLKFRMTKMVVKNSSSAVRGEGPTAG